MVHSAEGSEVEGVEEAGADVEVELAGRVWKEKQGEACGVKGVRGGVGCRDHSEGASGRGRDCQLLGNRTVLLKDSRARHQRL